MASCSHPTVAALAALAVVSATAWARPPATSGRVQALEVGIELPTRFPVGGGPDCRVFTRLRLLSILWRPGAPKGATPNLQVALTAEFRDPVAGCGDEEVHEPWFRAVDDAGLRHVLDIPDLALLGGDSEVGDSLRLVARAELPGRVRRLRIAVGRARNSDGHIEVDLARRRAGLAKAGELPAPQAWPALESLLAAPPGNSRLKPIRPRLRLEPGRLKTADSPCLEKVDLLVPELRIEPASDGSAELVVRRVYTNWGVEKACELPSHLWLLAEGGGRVVPPAPPLAVVQPLASYTDEVRIPLPASPDLRFVVGKPGSTEALLQGALELSPPALRLSQEVSGRVLDSEGAPEEGAEVILTRPSDDRPIRGERRITDRQGRFSFQFVEPGAYRVIASTSQLEARSPVRVDTAAVHLGDLKLAEPPVRPGLIGVRLQEVDGGGGVYVEHVIRGSPADRAGLEDGDLLLAADGVPLRTIAQAHDHVPGQPGTAVRITYKRGGDPKTIRIVRQP